MTELRAVDQFHNENEGVAAGQINIVVEQSVSQSLFNFSHVTLWTPHQAKPSSVYNQESYKANSSSLQLLHSLSHGSAAQDTRDPSKNQ